MSVALLPRRGRLRRTLVAALVPLGLALALLVDGSPVVGAAPSPTPGRAAPLPSAGGPAFAALAPTPSPANGAAVPGPLDLDSLDEEPVRHWGVVGTGLTDTKSKPHVWDFAEIGDRIYVAGTFTGVQEYGFDPASVVFPQAYLAAFDRDSGEWIPEFAPHLNRTVYALAVSPSGNLLVGGEFDTVNGAARAGLVMVDPQTGATVAGFSTEVAAFEPGERGIVRELVVDGTDVYVAGDFSYFVRAGASNFVWNAVRIRADSGLLDPAWLPQFAGSVWDLAIDHGRGRVHAVGFFTSANASPDTNRFATVTQATGASVTGLPQLEFNTRGQIDTVAVAFAGDKIWVGGAQHLLQVLDGETNQRVGFSVMGGSCEDFIQSPCPFIGGGDYQVIEVFGDTVLAGCHCFRPSEQRDPANVVWDTINHYDSFSDSRSEQRAAIGYDASTGRVASPFIPGLAEDYHGIWALHVDANGCLFVGGYVNRTESGDWRGGFGKFCRPVPAPASLSGFSADETVRLSWDRPESQLPVDRYKVYSDGAFLGDTAGLSFTDVSPLAGSTPRYSVRTLDSAGRLSAEAALPIAVAGPDTTPPAPPSPVTAIADGSTVTLTWSPAVDDQGVQEYLVHRDFQFVTTVAAGSTAFSDVSIPNGAYRYDVRARDFGGNLSDPATAAVTVGAPDLSPPTVPGAVIGTVAADAVTLSWTASIDLPDPGGSGVAGYLVHRDFQYLAWVPAGTTYVDHAVPAGAHRYEIRAQDRAGNNSNASAPVNLTIGPPDTAAPTVPTGVTASVAGGAVTLSWSPSVDLPNPGGSGVAGYLVHRDFGFVAWVPTGTTFTDVGVTPGSHRYEIRAQDHLGQNSAPSTPVVVVVA